MGRKRIRRSWRRRRLPGAPEEGTAVAVDDREDAAIRCRDRGFEVAGGLELESGWDLGWSDDWQAEKYRRIIEGCRARGVPLEAAENVFRKIEGFAAFGFPRLTPPRSVSSPT